MKLGELQTLRVEKTVPFGIYLTGEDPEEGRVLLPRSQVPEGVREGDFPVPWRRMDYPSRRLVDDDDVAILENHIFIHTHMTGRELIIWLFVQILRSYRNGQRQVSGMDRPTIGVLVIMDPAIRINPVNII